MYRDYIWIGEPIPTLKDTDHAAFLLHMQKAILVSLEKRKLLTSSERALCTAELEKQYGAQKRQT